MLAARGVPARRGRASAHLNRSAIIVAGAGPAISTVFEGDVLRGLLTRHYISRFAAPRAWPPRRRKEGLICQTRSVSSSWLAVLLIHAVVRGSHIRGASATAGLSSVSLVACWD